MYKDLTEQGKKRAKDMGYVGLFSERETTEEAYRYMMSIIETLPPGDKQAVLTGFHVFSNTVIVQLAKHYR